MRCLSHQYVTKLHRDTSHENDDMTTHKWPQFVPDDVKHNDIYVMNEYICILYRNSLRQKKCLIRHVQIVYSLHDILQDLQNILPLERRVISPQIPFITILVMR